MKHREVSFAMALYFLLAVVLILLGMGLGLHTMYRLEQVGTDLQSQEELMQSIRGAALYAIAFSGMVVTGVGMLIVGTLHTLRRTSRLLKEADALRERNKAMEELNLQTRELAHHQRLELLGTLTSSIAHEFNNLLTPIMGYSLMVLEKLPPQEEDIYDNILEVYNASCQAKTIISRLSDLSRKNTDHTFRMASADELIQKALDVAAPAKPEKVEIRLDLNCQDQRIRVNEIQISQMLLNLILNAFQAMDGQGILSIKTSFDDKYVGIRIEDTGCGISEKDKGRIFDPFFTTKETGRGTGLGLAIVAQVVEDHKGEIKVESKVGEGTRFSVRLPRERQTP